MRELLSDGGWQGLLALGSALFWGLFPNVISERVTVPLFVLSLLLVGCAWWSWDARCGASAARRCC